MYFLRRSVSGVYLGMFQYKMVLVGNYCLFSILKQFPFVFVICLVGKVLLMECHPFPLRIVAMQCFPFIFFKQEKENLNFYLKGFDRYIPK